MTDRYEGKITNEDKIADEGKIGIEGKMTDRHEVKMDDMKAKLLMKAKLK